MLATILKVGARVAFAVIAFIVFAAVWLYIATALFGAIVLVGLMWLFNARFSVTQNGTKIGTYTRKRGVRRI